MKFKPGDKIRIVKLCNENGEDITETYTDEPYLKAFKNKEVLVIEKIVESDDYPIHIKDPYTMSLMEVEAEMAFNSWQERYQ